MRLFKATANKVPDNKSKLLSMGKNMVVILRKLCYQKDMKLWKDFNNFSNLL